VDSSSSSSSEDDDSDDSWGVGERVCFLDSMEISGMARDVKERLLEGVVKFDVFGVSRGTKCAHQIGRWN
jgi:hypothetical protein